MIRFIYIGAQIYGTTDDTDNKDFAFWDTTTDKFICFGDEQLDVVFDSIESFVKAFKSPDNKWGKRSLEQMIALIHKDKVFRDKPED